MDFFLKYKKIILLIIFLIVIVVLGYLLYALFFKTKESNVVVTKPPIATSTKGLPVAQTGAGQIITPTETVGLPGKTGETETTKISSLAQGGLTQTVELNNSPSLGATLAGNGSDLQYYNQADGKFYRLTKDGKASPLTDKVFYQVDKIFWSPDKNKAILKYPDGANIVYDFTTNQQITLPSHWKDFDFSPDGSKIVMKSIGLDPNNRWLAISNLDGSNAQRVEALGDKDETVYPAWSPNNQIIAMYTEGLDFDRQEVYFVGLHNENFKSTIIEGRGFEPKWAPQGDKLLYSVYSSANNLKPMLWLVNASGDNIGSNRISLNVETWADKCTFANATDLYCAVPQSLEEGAGLFPEMANNTKDNLYKIDLQTGLKKLIAIPNGDYSISDINISDNGYDLYFTDQTTKTLHQVKLK